MDRTTDSAERASRLNGETNAFLEGLNDGPLTFAQLLATVRATEELSKGQLAQRLDISRQHLHQLESGQKRVSIKRAVRFAGALGHSEVYFAQLALQDLLNDAGIRGRVEVKAA